MSASCKMGPPLCPDCPFGKKCSELATSGMLERWRDREGKQWSWGRDGCAWFHFCQKCHLVEWPYDLRTGRQSRKKRADGEEQQGGGGGGAAERGAGRGGRGPMSMSEGG